MLSEKIDFLATFALDRAETGLAPDDTAKFATILADYADQARMIEDAAIPAAARAVPAEAGGNVVFLAGRRYRAQGGSK